MKNGIFEIEFDSERGILTSLVALGDPERANFIKSGRGLGELHPMLWYALDGNKNTKAMQQWELESFTEGTSSACAVFNMRGVRIEQTFELTESDLRIRMRVTNENFYPVYFKREDLSFYTPFADSYDDSLTCQRVRCHAHMAPFLDNSYIRAERMGISDYNVGVLFLKGAAYSYSQEDCPNSNDRGYLIMNVEPFSLTSGKSYDIELAVFTHRGGEDFARAAARYPEYIRVDSTAYVLYKGEGAELTLTASQDIASASVTCAGRRIPLTVKGRTVSVPLCWKSYGEKKISYEINGRRGEAYYFVSPPLELLQKKRARFLVRKQQCTDRESPLYGAYLIYDNEEKRQYFSYEWTDHNANRERMCIPIFLVKYLRKTGDEAVKRSIYLYTDFLLRESVDEASGKAYNNIGKEAKTTRLYNAPWVILYFCELYLYDGNMRWVDLALRMTREYYKNGGTGFYPNGIRFSEMRRAFEKSGRQSEYAEVCALFDEHIATLMRKGTSYPPHEVNYEQTIVTPAACLMIDKYLMTGDEVYVREAKRHLDLLEKFNGCQPDYRLNKVPLRYWDNYWFGKTRSCEFGDTLPHPALAHSAHCFYSYGVVTGEKKWIDYGIASWRSGFCLFNGKGEASSAYVYPERVNGMKGAYFDRFATEQDGFLYLAYKLTEEL